MNEFNGLIVKAVVAFFYARTLIKNKTFQHCDFPLSKFDNGICGNNQQCCINKIFFCSTSYSITNIKRVNSYCFVAATANELVVGRW